MSCSEIFKLVLDIAIAAAAITGAVVAVRGLSEWKVQLKGKEDYVLARRILVNLFRYRDAINGVRHPAMFGYEMPSPSADEAAHMSQDQIRFFGTSKAYQTRWDKVNAQKTELYADLLEAEAIWGGQLNSLFSSLFALEHELYTRVRHYLILIDPDAAQSKKDVIERFEEANRDIMYDDMSYEPDDFKADMLREISEIENYLKPKLGSAKK